MVSYYINSPYMVPDSIPGSGRSPGVGNDTLLQYSCLENSMGRGAGQATGHGVTKTDMAEQLNIVLQKISLNEDGIVSYACGLASIQANKSKMLEDKTQVLRRQKILILTFFNGSTTSRLRPPLTLAQVSV